MAKEAAVFYRFFRRLDLCIGCAFLLITRTVHQFHSRGLQLTGFYQIDRILFEIAPGSDKRIG